jgi:hypothetical protein
MCAWIRSDEAGEEAFSGFSDAVKRAESESENWLVERVRAAAEDPKYWTAAMTLLERRFPERWGNKIRQAVNEQIEDIVSRVKAELDEETHERVTLALRNSLARQREIVLARAA